MTEIKVTTNSSSPSSSYPDHSAATASASSETVQPINGPAPSSPSASFYAMSDEEEGDYGTIRHTSTGKGVKLLFSKSKVYVHPTPSAKDNIPGFVALIQQKPADTRTDKAGRRGSAASSHSVAASSLLLAWIPESSLGDAYDAYVKVDLADSASPPKQTFLVPPLPTTVTGRGGSTPGTYAFAVPVSEIYSLLVRPPNLGWWYGSVVINTRAGDSFPALFFHDSECQSTILQRKRRTRDNFDPFSDGGGLFWGGDEVLRWLKRYFRIERSGADLSVFLVEPTEEDRIGFGFNGARRSSTSKEGQAANRDADRNSATPAAAGRRDGGMDPVTKTLKEARWRFLEKLSQVTTFTRRTAQAVAENPNLPPQVRRLMKNPEVQTLQEEFDSARVYLARLAMGMAEQSERDRSQRMWTARDFLEMEESAVGEFEILEMETSSLSLQERRKTVTLKEWNSFFDTNFGKLEITPDEVKERIFHGGLDADDGVRKEAWLFLLGVHEWESTRAERQAHVNSLRDEYLRLKGGWWERLGHSEGETADWWKDQKSRIEKDVHRTDRAVALFAGEDCAHPDPDSPFSDVGTNVHLEQMKDMLLTYNEYNRSLGYVQGMSDLLAPIYAVLQDDALAFWAFARFMDRMERNFLRDQSGMRKQLMTLDQLLQLLDPKLYLHLQAAESTNFFFFFRMLLVWYKREFEWDDVLRLWECLWTDYLSGNFHLFIALAILEHHRDVIMTHLKHFDEVLKYINELSGTIELESTFAGAESLFRKFQRTVESIDKRDNFPLPRLTQPKSASTKLDQAAKKEAASPLAGQSPAAAAAAAANARPPSPSFSSPSSSPSSKVAIQLSSSPAPTAETPVASEPSATAAAAAAAAADASAADRTVPSSSVAAPPPSPPAPSTSGDPSKRVISPELRQLLTRKVDRMYKGEVIMHGGGVGT